jgi:hypothetical protein
VKIVFKVSGLYTFPADFGSVPGTQSSSSRHARISLRVKARGQRDLITVQKMPTEERIDLGLPAHQKS